MSSTHTPSGPTSDNSDTWSTDALAKLLSIFDLEQLEHNLFRGRGPTQGWQRVFGGQVIGQALTAAVRTVEDRNVHSLHSYFLLPGDPATPIIYDVDRIRDGRSFTTRRVIAIQHGRAIFSLSASFHNNEESLDHQTAMPDVPHPDSLPSEEELKRKFVGDIPDHIKAYWQIERPIEMRPVDQSRLFGGSGSGEPHQYVWMRATGRLPDEPRMHQCVLAYASDFTLLDTALIAHDRAVYAADIQMASLDHAVWFHRPFRADEWLLYAQDSPSANGGRGFCLGHVYTADGTLVASVAQEGVTRLKSTS